MHKRTGGVNVLLWKNQRPLPLSRCAVQPSGRKAFAASSACLASLPLSATRSASARASSAVLAASASRACKRHKYTHTQGKQSILHKWRAYKNGVCTKLIIVDMAWSQARRSTSPSTYDGDDHSLGRYGFQSLSATPHLLRDGRHVGLLLGLRAPLLRLTLLVKRRKLDRERRVVPSRACSL